MPLRIHDARLNDRNLVRARDRDLQIQLPSLPLQLHLPPDNLRYARLGMIQIILDQPGVGDDRHVHHEQIDG